MCWRRSALGKYRTIPYVSESVKITHDEFARVLRSVGYAQDVIQEIEAQLEDPIDVDRDERILTRYGLTQGRLMELMGSSP
jgi:hypothetical protein